MDGAPDQAPGDTPYLKLPWPLVAGALLAVLLLALAAGLYANRYLRPQLGPAVTPTAAALAALVSPTALRTPPPAAGQTVAPTTPTANPTAQSIGTPPSGTPVPTATPTGLAAQTPLPSTVSASPRATVSPAQADEVGQAYERYWQIRAEAFLLLEPARLPEAAAGEHLASLRSQIDELRAQGKAIQTDVQHHYVVVAATASEAQVGDDYISNSTYVDPSTHVRLSDPTGDNLREFYTLDRIDGEWKVVSLVRAP